MKHTCKMNDLVREGATVAARLGCDPSRALTIDPHGNLPPRADVRMLIDTGAELSHLSENIAVRLGLRHVDDTVIVGVTGVAESRPVYLATLHLPIDKPSPTILAIPLRVVGMRESISARTPFDGLLGRAFLAAFNLAYAGPVQTFALQTTPGLIEP